MSDDLRADIRAAMTETNSAEAAGTAAEVVSTPAEPAEAAPSGSGDTSTPDGRTGAGDVPRADGRTRDATGKFVKAEAPKSEVAKPDKPIEAPKPTPSAQTGTVAPAPATTTATPPPKFKAPQAWTPTAREKWAALPEDIQELIDKREREATRMATTYAEPLKFHQAFQQAVSPYQALIQAQGGDPLKFTQSLYQTAYQLYAAPPVQKAQILAELVKSYGVPIEALDQALAGVAPQASTQQAVNPAQLEQQITQRILGQLQQRQQQAMSNQSAKTIESFGADRDFFEDVRDEMADIIEGRARRGVEINLEDAYSLALKMHRADEKSEIGKVLRQREAAEAAKAQAASTQRARAAASSVKSEPAGTVSAPAEDLRSAIRESIAELNRR